MYLNRKTLKLNSLKNQISNSQLQSQSLSSITGFNKKIKPLAEAVRYPVLNYFIGLVFLGFFVYLIYSVQGGKQAIPGFNSNEWWQYLISTIPFLIFLLLILLSSEESVRIHRGKIEFRKHILLGFYKKESVERQLADLINISIIKKGYERITMTTSSYFVVFNFKPFEEIEALECSSEITAVGYLQHLRAGIPHLRTTLRFISVKDIVET